MRLRKKTFFYLSFVGITLSSCNNAIIEEKIIAEEKSSWSEFSEESKIIEAFNDFIGNFETTSKTKSIIPKDIQVIDIKKVPVSTYSGTQTKTTKSVTNDLGVYELKLKNKTDNTGGFAIVTDDTDINEVIAYAPVGSISDTIYNKALALYFRSLTFLKKPVDSISQTRMIDPDFAQGNLGEMLYYTIGIEEYYRDLTKDEISKYGSSWVFYAPVHRTRIVPVYVLTQWAQTFPYNNKVDQYFNNEKYPIGCVNVAIGQIMSYHRKPDKYNWNALNYRPVVSSSSSPVIIEEVSQLLWDLALLSKTSFKNGKTSTNSGNIISTFESMGYTVKRKGFWSETSIKFVADEIMNNSRPVLHTGSDGVEGHAWVVDEVIMRECWKYFSRYTNGKYVLHRIKVQGYSLHCNWGWGGNSDGYYYNFTPTRDNVEFYQNLTVYYDIKPKN